MSCGCVGEKGFPCCLFLGLSVQIKSGFDVFERREFHVVYFWVSQFNKNPNVLWMCWREGIPCFLNGSLRSKSDCVGEKKIQWILKWVSPLQKNG
jgi:hypothetical protein